MITIRYPNGQAISYNKAYTLYRETDAWMLYTTTKDKGGALVVAVQVTAGCVIEWSQPCKVENAALTVKKAAEVLAKCSDELHQLPGSVLRDLKIALQRFNARTRTWR